MVRKLPAVLGVSVAVHAAVLAWLATVAPTRPLFQDPGDREQATPVEILPPPPVVRPVPDAPPVDVAFLDEAATARIEQEAPQPAPEPEPAPAKGTSRPRIAASATATPGTETPGATGPRNPYMDMRRPGAKRVALPTYEWSPDMPPGPPPPKDETTGQLQDSGGGTKRSDQGVFVAHVDQDGNVKLKDQRNLQFHLGLPSPKVLGNAIADWYENPNKLGSSEGGETIPDAGGSSDSGGKPDHGGVASIPIVGGSFDATDAFMRRHGQDPYASKKLKFLDSTRDERVQIGMRHRSEQLASTPETVRKNLARLWATETDPAARREALFELWDESVETGSEELVAAGTAARKLVIAWIRDKLPAGSPDAYGAAELAAFNQRRTSQAAFAPYE